MSEQRVQGHALKRTCKTEPDSDGGFRSFLSWACECGEHLGDAPDVNTHGVRKIHREHKASLNGSSAL